MAAEAAGVERERHAGRERELADGDAGRALWEPAHVARDLVGRRRADDRVVEGGRRTIEQAALARGMADDRALALGACELDRDDLPEPALVTVGEDDVRAGLEHEPVERRLVREAPPVHGRRDGRDRRFEPVPRVVHRVILSETLRQERGLYAVRPELYSRSTRCWWPSSSVSGSRPSPSG